MKNKDDTKKFFLYIIIFVPLIFIGLETTFFTVNKFKGIKLKSNWSFKYDQLNGWRGLVKKNEEKKGYQFSLNKHSLFDTPYEVDINSKKTTTGILISGNSFAAAGFQGNGEKNKNAFFSKLETKLREENFDIDVVNIAFHDYTLWQEHVEVARYLNSAYLHNDLPNIKLVISTGGIQDFHNFESMLHSNHSNNTDKIKYLNANGMMQRIQPINYIQNISVAQQGRPLFALKALFDSIRTYWQSYSHTNYYFAQLSRQVKYTVKGWIGRDRWELFRGRQIEEPKSNEEIQYDLSLEELITQKYKLTLEKYINLREYSINSAVRNIRATKALLGDDIKYVYMYTPTFFNSAISDFEARKLMIPSMGIVFGDYQKLEEDFRNEFLKKLSSVPEIEVLDYSGTANAKTWFQDYTHLNFYGEDKFSKLIYPRILKIVKNLID